MTGRRWRLAILLSGRGSNFEAIADAVREGTIPDAEIVAVISDVPQARGLERARELALPAFTVERSAAESRQAHEGRILEILDRVRPDLVCMAGYMRILSAGFVGRYAERILNIHPSLLPLYPGLEPQRRALETGDVESGCTVHVVDRGTDSGPIVLQRRVPILPGDDPDSLSARILNEEHAAYPEAITRVLAGLPRPD
jgi:phosphoribosylglycinamide formyltransferase-1